MVAGGEMTVRKKRFLITSDHNMKGRVKILKRNARKQTELMTAEVGLRREPGRGGASSVPFPSWFSV